MPQLAQLALVYQSQWFWLLLTLGAIYFFVGRGIVPKVEATVDARDAQISRDLAEAERLRAEAEATEEAWRKQINDAHAQAQSATAEAKAAATQAADQRIHAADVATMAKVDAATVQLNQARQSALAEMEVVAADAVRDIVAKLTGVAVTEQTALASVAGAMSHG